MAILLVILGHCHGSLDEPLNQVINSFHMPLFFFLSGYVAKLSAERFGPLLRKKLWVLLLPQMVIGITFVAWDLMAGKVSIGKIMQDFTVWFLIVLLWCVIAFFWLARLIKDDSLGWIISASISLIISIVVLYSGASVPYLHFEILPMGLFFYLLGYISKNSNAMDAIHLRLKQGLWIFLAPTMVLLALSNGSVAMYLSQYGNPILFIASSISGIIFTVELSRSLDGSGLLVWLGANSVIIYVLQFKVIDAVKAVLTRAVPDYISFPEVWVCFLLACAIVLPLAWFCEKKLGFLFGKGKLPKLTKSSCYK